MIVKALFWASLSGLAWTHVGYPVAAAGLRQLKRREVEKDDITPTVTLIVPAHDEEEVIGARVENLLALDYPQDKLELVIASDASTDRTHEIVRSYDGKVRLLECERAGKLPTMNAAVRETEDAAPVDFGGTIREGAPDDLDMVAEFDEILWLLQSRSPSFSGLAVPSRDEFRDEWSDLWDDPEVFTHFVAERDGRVVGHAVLYARPEGDLRVPPRNIDLAHAATVDDVRGSGVGLALTAHVLRWAKEHGYESMTTDWRSVNLLSSRFWPRRGFRPQYLRLYRAVP